MSASDPTSLSPGEILQQILAERGMSRIELASRLGIPLERINSLIAGKETITHEVALQLAHLFDCSARFFQR